MKKKSICPPNYIKKKKKKKKKETKHDSVNNLWRILGTNLLLVNFWDRIFKIVFPKQFVLLKNLGCLEPCVNCVTKCVTDKIYPMEVKILESFFANKKFRPFSYKSDIPF